MNSSGIQSNRTDLVDRLSSVMQAARGLRSEVAATICESNEVRLASRRLRMDSLRTRRRSAAQRTGLYAHHIQGRQEIAQAIAQVLSGRGYSVFVATQPQDTAPIQ
jgi:hypothetical protein